MTAFEILKKYRNFIVYGIICVIVLIVDTVISYTFETYFGLLKEFANSIGIISGFILQYVLSSKRVFNSSNPRTFIIFLGTFILGLFVANGALILGRDFLFLNMGYNISWILSKGLSVVASFFPTYFIRKKLIISDKDCEK